jgi:predicted Ser/Thr protein kinase
MSGPSGSHVGPYRLLHLIGAGGMGEVYAAEDPRLGRTVALKRLLASVASDPDRVRRFAQEAKAVAALNHPGIVTIYSVEEADGHPFITMELVEGRSLADLIPDGGLDIDRVLQLGAAIAEAVNAAHSRSIIHRDLKPANVIITPEGAVKILDFGLAKLQRQPALADDATRTLSRTAESVLVGTVSYMSPEQAEGKSIDHRSDIFSIGVILYEMTTGQRPFQGDTTLSILSAILRESPRRLSDRRPTAPLELEGIVNRCLEKDRALRYHSAADLAADLKRVAEGGRARLPSASAASTPVGRRRLPKSLAVGLVAIALAAGAAAAWKLAGRRPRAVTAEQISRITNDGTATVAAISPDGRHIVHVKNTKGQPSLWVRQTTTQNDLEIVAPAAVRYMGATYSTDGNDVLYVTYPNGGEWGTLYRVSALGGEPRPVTRDVDSGVGVSPDGKRLAFVRYQSTRRGTQSRLLTVGSDGTDEQVVATRTGGDLFRPLTPSWSDDGNRILTAVATSDGKFAIAITTVTTGEVRAVPGEWISVGGFAWLARLFWSPPPPRWPNRRSYGKWAPPTARARELPPTSHTTEP